MLLLAHPPDCQTTHPEMPLRQNLLAPHLTSQGWHAPSWNDQRLRCHAVSPEQGGSGSAVPALHVLLVDDHEDTNRSLTLLLGRRGYKVQAATSLAAAEVMCSLEAFDVLICDMSLPDGRGLDLLARLTASPPRLGAIVLSGYNTDEDIDRSLAAGYKAHLGKPVEIDKLDAAIKRLRR